MKKKAAPKHPKLEKVEEKPEPKAEKLDLQQVLLNAYRAITPDVTKLTGNQKDELLALIEIDARNETTYRYPDKQRVREMLKANLLK